MPTTNISHQLVSAQIITTDDIEEIAAIPRSKEKASYVLRIVARSLEVGMTPSFYALLHIMENYGGDSTTLANDIKRAVVEYAGIVLCNLSDLHHLVVMLQAMFTHTYIATLYIVNVHIFKCATVCFT